MNTGIELAKAVILEAVALERLRAVALAHGKVRSRPERGSSWRKAGHRMAEQQDFMAGQDAALPPSDR